MQSVIYSITNKFNGKVYIGSTINFEKRKSQHLAMLKKGRHGNVNINIDLNEFDYTAFRIDVLSTFDNIPTLWLRYLENSWIDYCSYHFNLYNVNHNTIGFGQIKHSFPTRNERLAFRKVKKVEMTKINEIVKVTILSHNKQD